MTPDDLTSRAQGEAERRWPEDFRPFGGNGAKRDAFRSGATWAAAQAPSVEALTAEVERLRASVDGVAAERDAYEADADSLRAIVDSGAYALADESKYNTLAARLDRLRAGIEGAADNIRANMPLCAESDLRALLAEDEAT